MAAQPAKVYSGRYEILRQVARGGMAEVYLAHDQLLDRPVALKVLFPELSVDQAFVERFRREAQAAANLSHPNIVSVYDWGEEEDTYFIVMEYVDGQPLSSLIQTEGPLLADRAAAIGADVAGALAFAHRNGVVHRDVKPGNVLIDVNGHVKVADFGIARAGTAQENLTQTGAVMGTATYFSPEQAQGHGVDARSDVYSLGVVLYEMVTGRPPFRGENAVSIAYKHVREDPVPPRETNPVIPSGFEAIVLQAMAKDPQDRYATAEELRADLLRFHQGRTVMAPPPTVVPPTQAVEAAATTAAVAPVSGDGPKTEAVAAPAADTTEAPTRTSAFVVLLLVMLAALLVLLFLLGRTLGLIGGEGAGQVVVPSVIGAPVAEAEDDLRALGLKVEKRFEHNDADPDTVFDQEPQGGEEVKRGSEVLLKVSEGPLPVDIPSVVGDDVEDARGELEWLGLSVEVSNQPHDTEPAGRVLAQDPRAGTRAPRGSTVRLTVSAGKGTVAVPNVVGREENAALAAVQSAGLRVRVVREPSTSQPEGRVTRTDPAGGTQVQRGSSVTVFVSSGPQTSSTTATTAPTTTTVRPTTTTSRRP